MKYKKRTNTYTASNVIFDANKIQAYSYGWWRFVSVVEGKVIFNNYRYSVSTSKHQSKVRNLMNQLGIKIDIEMPLPTGITSISLQELFLLAEEQLCLEFINDEYKKIRRSERAKERRDAKKLASIAIVTHAAHESQSVQMRMLTLVK